METKICCKCKKEKTLLQFGVLKSSKDGLRYDCKDCKKQQSKLYRETNKKPKKEKYQYDFRSIICLGCGNEHSGNFSHIVKYCSLKCRNKIKNSSPKTILSKEKYVVKNAEKVRKSKTDYIKNNPEQVELSRKKQSNKLTTKVKNTLRARIRKVLKGLSKGSSTLEMLGCDVNEFIKHIESQFLEGMNWSNWSLDGWHIDHKKPLSSAKNIDEMYKLCHYTNLQPLWAKDNMKKSNKISPEWKNA